MQEFTKFAVKFLYFWITAVNAACTWFYFWRYYVSCCYIISFRNLAFTVSDTEDERNLLPPTEILELFWILAAEFTACYKLYLGDNQLNCMFQLFFLNNGGCCFGSKSWRLLIWGGFWSLFGLKQFLTDCVVFTNLLKFLVGFCIHYYLHEV